MKYNPAVSSFIPFTNATSERQGFLIDSEDEELINESRWQWFTTKTGHTYAYSNRKKDGNVKAHRLIMGLVKGDPSVDHINGNGLDNRKANLRVAGQSLNNGNRLPQKGGTSKFKGVSWCKQTGQWKVRIYDKGKEVWLGRFRKEEDAARTYDKAALDVFGDYAKTNEMLGLFV